jgi:hypothetical protein
MIPALIRRAKSQIESLLKSGEYARAQLYENMSSALAELLVARQSQEQQGAKLKTLRSNVAEFERQLAEQRRKLQSVLSRHKEVVERAVEEEDVRWLKEADKFDEVTNRELPPGDRKFSSRLLNLRAQERFLLASRRYQDASVAKEEADRLEKEEMERLREFFVMKRDAQKNVLRDIHDQKVNCILAKGQVKEQELTRSGEKEIQRLRQAIENTQRRIQKLETGEVPQQPQTTPVTPTFLTQGGSPPPSTRKNRPRSGFS